MPSIKTAHEVYKKFFITCLIIPNLIIGSTLAQTGTQMRPAVRKVILPAGQSDYRLVLPKGSVATDSDGDYLYVAEKKSIKIMSESDILDAGKDNEDRILAPFWEVSLAHELKGQSIQDLAAYKLPGMHLIFVTTPSVNNSFELKTFAVRSRHNSSTPENSIQNLSTESKENLEQNELTKNDIGLFAIKGGLEHVIGNGEITVVREPHNGSPLLISLDSENGLLHTYDLNNPLRPLYKETFQLGLKDLKSFKLNNNSKTGTSFELVRNEQKLNLSLYSLRAKAKIERARALISLENEVKGNSWIKNLLFLGLFSNVIDYLDTQFGNPNVNVDKLEEDPVIRKLVQGVTDDEVFEYLKVNRLLSERELNELQGEYNLNKASGVKWFFTVAVVVGTLKFLHLKSKAPSINAAFNHYKKRLFSFSNRVVRPDTFAGKYVYKISKKVEATQLALRSRLIKNYYNMEYPAKTIKDFKKQLVKAKIISKEESKRISKLSLKEQYHFLKESVQKNTSKLKVLENSYHLKDQKLSKAISTSIEMNDVFVSKVNLNQQFRTLKAQVLAQLKKHHPEYKNVNLRSDDMTAYILATDKSTVMKKVDELNDFLKLNSKGQQYRNLGPKIEEVIERLNEVNKKIGIYGTEGKVAKVWDQWAAFTQMYSRFFIPEKVLASNNKVIKFVNNHSRLDAVKTGKETVEYVAIKGEHAKSAFYLGISDTLGEIVSQTVARSTLLDPNERTIGAGDNHLELVNINGQEYGVHFDLIVHTLENLVGWWLTMPLGLAKSGMSFGAKGKVTYTTRIFDGLKKSINPINYLYLQATYHYPILKLTSWMLELDYLQDHGENLNEDDFQKYKERIGSRLTSWQSFLERKLLVTGVYTPYVNPQFFMQAEFDKVARSLFNSSTPGTMVSALVMPLTSGFYPNRAFGEYFGTNNPYMIEMLKKFGAEGILQKIDKDGYTDINTWTEGEKSAFMNIMISLEMAKSSKERPLPRTAGAEEQTQWFAQVGKNLFGEAFMDADLKDLKSKVKISDPESKPENFRYATEAKELNAQLELIKRNTAVLPFIKDPVTDNSFLLMSRVKKTTQYNGLPELNEVSDIQSKLVDALKTMKDNHNTLSRQQKALVAVTIYDAIYLINANLLNNKIGHSIGLQATNIYANTKARFNNLYNQLRNTGTKENLNKAINKINSNNNVSNNLKKTSNALLLASIPIYLWLDNQVEAHIKIEKYITGLVSDLQEILYSMTKVIVSESIKGNLSLYNEVEKIEDLKDYLKSLKEKEDLLESIVLESKKESTKYLESRVYRAPKILANLGPIVMGISGTWILTHYLLFKNTKGFVSKMADNFAPNLFKYSLILWLSMSQVNSIVDKNMYLHTIDFLNLHKAYFTTLFEIALIEELIQSRESGEQLGQEIYDNAVKRVESDKVLNKMNDFRERLENLSVINND